MFVHHVLFWLKNPDNQEEYTKLLDGIRSLEPIEPKILFHLGAPATTNRAVIDTTYQFSLLLTFKNLEDQDKYQIDPIHLKFIDNCASLWEKVIIYDSVDA
ncbi:MAG: Dabb family protein [Sphingobacteriaceae bacterium]